MSVQLRIGDGVLHLADEFPELGVLAPPSVGGTPVVLALEVPDAEEVVAQAVAAGAEVRQPLADMFWGDLHGQLDDPFGPLECLSPLARRAARRGRGRCGTGLRTRVVEERLELPVGREVGALMQRNPPAPTGVPCPSEQEG
jgi:Glyoxalase/Bleomycin resistance protein/Dioxygenase superfamily